MEKLPDNSESKNLLLEKVSNYVGVAYGAANAVAGAAIVDPMSIIGGAATFFSNFISPYMQRNRDKFFNDLKRDFEELEKRMNIKFSEVLNNDKVLSAILEAYPIVIREHREEKRKILRNVVLNTALPSGIEDDLQFSFINYIGRLYPSHIIALQAYLEFCDKHNIDITEIENKYNSYLDELISLGLLIRPDPLSDSPKSHLFSRTCILTGKGRQFLDFIKSPLEK